MKKIQLFNPLLCPNKRKQCLLGAGSECVCSCVYFNRFPVTACNRARAHHVELVVDVGEAVLDDEVLHADSAVGGRVPGHDVGHVGHTLHAPRHHHVLGENTQKDGTFLGSCCILLSTGNGLT